MQDDEPGTETCLTSPAGPVFFTHSALEQAGPAIRHGFFTRTGGVSAPPYNSLNCGFGSDDQLDNVTENRARVAAALDLPADRLAGLYQTHSADCLMIDDAHGFAGAHAHGRVNADALVTALPSVGLAILTADCLPVLFADPVAGVVGAAHAGWRGAVAGIIENTIDRMQQAGAGLADIIMVTGPGIQQKSYQIGADMAADILTDRPDSAPCFMADPAAQSTASGPEHYLFDLPLFARLSAARHGLRHIYSSRLDTYARPDLFFSYRRATHEKTPDTGRLISVITRK